MIKAFNNIYFTSLLEKGKPKGTTGRKTANDAARAFFESQNRG